MKVLLFFVPFVLALSAIGDGFVQIEGTIDLIAYAGTNAAPASKSTFGFTCITGTEKWSMSTTFLSNAIEHYYFDGTNVYAWWEVTALAKADDVPLPIKLPQTERTVDQMNASPMLRISPGAHPLGNPGVNLPWLAFCSGRYLKESNRLVPPPIEDIRFCSDAFAYRDETTTFDDDLGLPQTIKLYQSIQLLQKNKQDERLFLPKQGRPSIPLYVQDGRLGCHYSVEQTTNYLRWRLPTEFSVVQYTYSLANELRWRTLASAKVFSVREAALPSGPFEAGKHYHIVDLRFKSKNKVLDSLQYVWTNSSVPTIENQSLQRVFADVEKRRPRRVPSGGRLYVLVFLSLTFFGIPLIMWIFNKRRSTSSD